MLAPVSQGQAIGSMQLDELGLGGYSRSISTTSQEQKRCA